MAVVKKPYRVARPFHKDCNGLNDVFAKNKDGRLRRKLNIGERAGLTCGVTDSVGQDGVTYFLFSRCGNYMKIGRVRKGSLSTRVREINREEPYAGHDFSVAFTVDDSRIEFDLHQLFRETRMHYRIKVTPNGKHYRDYTIRCTYKQYCAHNGFQYRFHNIGYLRSGVELFRTMGMGPEKIQRIVINEFLKVGIKINLLTRPFADLELKNDH